MFGNLDVASRVTIDERDVPADTSTPVKEGEGSDLDVAIVVSGHFPPRPVRLSGGLTISRAVAKPSTSVTPWPGFCKQIAAVNPRTVTQTRR